MSAQRLSEKTLRRVERETGEGPFVRGLAHGDNWYYLISPGPEGGFEGHRHATYNVKTGALEYIDRGQRGSTSVHYSSCLTAEDWARSFGTSSGQEATTASPNLPLVTLNHLRDLQDRIGTSSEAKGFHERGKHLIAQIQHSDHWLSKNPDVEVDEPRAEFHASLRDYAVARAARITTEVAKLIEELRDGRAVDETYYLYEDGSQAQPRGNRPASVDPLDRPRKPEGVPAELADIVIRSFDFAHEFGIDLAAMIGERLAYDAACTVDENA